MQFLKPHLYLFPKPGENEFELTIIVLVNDNVIMSKKPKITKGCVITAPNDPHKGKKETIIDLHFDDQVGVIHYKPMELNIRLENPNYPDEIRVTVRTHHGDHPHHDHNGTSSAHYGDPKP
jgi:hypothetical protein